MFHRTPSCWAVLRLSSLFQGYYHKIDAECIWRLKIPCCKDSITRNSPVTEKAKGCLNIKEGLEVDAVNKSCFLIFFQAMFVLAMPLLLSQLVLIHLYKTRSIKPACFCFQDVPCSWEIADVRVQAKWVTAFISWHLERGRGRESWRSEWSRRGGGGG